MEPLIKNFRNVHTPGSLSSRSIGLDDNPPTCTMTYSEIIPDQTSTHHIHSWEHEIFIIKGSGTLVCDGKDYPVKEGDAIFIPGNVDHYTLNNGGQGVIRRIETNPLIAAQSGGARNNGGTGSGQPPVIRNLQELKGGEGRLILSSDGALNYFMLYTELAGDHSSHQESREHTHPWEHEAYVLEGSGVLLCGGRQEYGVSEGDGILVPGDTHHQWCNPGQHPVKRLTINPLAAEAGEG